LVPERRVQPVLVVDLCDETINAAMGVPDGGAAQSGAPRGNRIAHKHGLFSGEAIAERKQIQALLSGARKLLQEMK